jgi:ATP-binding cassette, subfamily A (ABC1), member 3
MMFTGGSHVCCIDEVSSGLDSLSRRKIWDILLAERGRRTIIMTTHFLDEAEVLADHIAILSKGTLRVEGSAVELKHRLGGGYKIHVTHTTPDNAPIIEGFLTPTTQATPDKVITTFSIPDSSQAARLVTQLEQQGFTEYHVVGPTVEDVFMAVAEEVKSTRKSSPLPSVKEVKAGTSTTTTSVLLEGEKEPAQTPPTDGALSKGVVLYNGHTLSLPSQAFVLFCKRLTVLRRNFLPLLAAFIIPIIASIFIRTFIRQFGSRGCSSEDQSSSFSPQDFTISQNFDMVVGPTSRLGLASLTKFGALYQGSITGSENMSSLLQSVHFVDTLGDFNDYVDHNFHNLTPGGFFLGGLPAGSPSTFSYRADLDLYYALITQNALSVLSTNISIGTQYLPFDVPFSPDSKYTLQFITYFGLAMVAFPGFFALYPTGERLRNVRSLQYSNGVRALPLWTAYAAFDFLVVLASSVIIIALFASAANRVWYHLPYLFVVIMLYGLASILLAYVISLFAKSQLASFALCSGGQAYVAILFKLPHAFPPHRYANFSLGSCFSSISSHTF